ncbi:ER membrane protein complex subunit 10-like [Chenopodium quinoa]|uniref:ER membrane protein complex subunit 10-like n=1 Tax=Chenopodium quinoa TaxID=63459 RepID=UPI000B7968D7|nr:ER membrane protein complex subunit 10-like [Chenopodium quinoa]
MKTSLSLFLLLTLSFSLLFSHSLSFQSDELLLDDDEFEGLSKQQSSDIPRSSTPSPPTTAAIPTTTRRRSSDSDIDSKLQFNVEHAFGDSQFSHAGTFSARLKSWSHGGQTLTKLRFSRNTLTSSEQEKFKELLQTDDFYKIRLPSNVLSPPGRNYTVSAVKARCLAREALDEHFVIHMEGVNILAVNYGSFGACPYPRQLKFPSKWSFNSHSVLKYSELAPRTPVFVEETPEETAEAEAMNQPEKSFWAKYWMYLIPLGLMIMNGMTQALNVPEEATGQAGGGQQPGRLPNAAVRRR